MERLDAICDGRELLSSDQVAALIGKHPDAIRQAVHRGTLCPAKVGSQLVFTRADVERWVKHGTEHLIASELAKGLHPVDVYLESRGAWSLAQVTRVMLAWARLSGVWLVEAPRGSYARWLERHGLTSLPPRAMRRLVEALLLDEYVRRVVLRSLATELPSAAKRADSPTGEGLATAATASALAPGE